MSLQNWRTTRPEGMCPCALQVMAIFHTSISKKWDMTTISLILSNQIFHNFWNIHFANVFVVCCHGLHIIFLFTCQRTDNEYYLSSNTVSLKNTPHFWEIYVFIVAKRFMLNKLDYINTMNKVREERGNKENLQIHILCYHIALHTCTNINKSLIFLVLLRFILRSNFVNTYSLIMKNYPCSPYMLSAPWHKWCSFAGCRFYLTVYSEW